VYTYFTGENQSYPRGGSYLRAHAFASLTIRSLEKRFYFLGLRFSQRYLGKLQSSAELLDFWTFSIVWYSREHDVSETGSVSVLR
jgi:hypothetical protein